jgi:uncharacterized protein (TIGR02145 family)
MDLIPLNNKHMKTITLSMLLILAGFHCYTQNYQITFTGSGASTTVDSVKVENLSQCTSLVLAGTDTLHLLSTVGINEGNQPEDHVTIYPNPSPGYFSVEMEANTTGILRIGLFDMSGNVVIQHKEIANKGINLFELNSIPSGIYLLKAESDHLLYSSKVISTGGEKDHPVIRYCGPVRVTGKESSLTRATEVNGPVSIKSVVIMQFNAGDTLKLTGKSGIFRTVSMLFPTQSQLVTFDFTDCTDADSNHYAVVQIGSQLWMQENLKTTKYRDGSDIPNVQDSAMWANLTTGAWCDFHNLPSEGAQYGHLYNFYAGDDARKMCPAGWHMPSNSEWNILEKFLDNTVDTTALMGTGALIGRILKEGCDTRWQYMDTTYGLNSAGFTALCANFRNGTGAWSLAPDNNHDTSFWTATSYSTSSAWFRSLRWCFSDIYSLFAFKRGGNSVRCVKD